MDAKQKKARLKRINDVFNTCIDGTEGLSTIFFGADSFQALIGKKFYFFSNEGYMLKNEIDDFPVEALLGQVIGVKFRFCDDLVEYPKDLPEECDSKEYLAERETVCELSDQSCLPFIQTTIGELTCFSEEFCMLKGFSPEIEDLEGAAVFL